MNATLIGRLLAKLSPATTTPEQPMLWWRNSLTGERHTDATWFDPAGVEYHCVISVDEYDRVKVEIDGQLPGPDGAMLPTQVIGFQDSNSFGVFASFISRTAESLL